MDRAQPTPVGFYRAAEVARMLRCSEWWVKEQARRRRIPYAWIGGSYLFTDQHIAEIVRRFEVPALDADFAAVRDDRPRRKVDAGPGEVVPLLRARPPRRARPGRPESEAA
jgi:hypothetical protein